MSHLQFSAGKGKNTSIGTKHRGAVTAESAAKFVEREHDFQRKKQNIEKLDKDNAAAAHFEGQWVDPTPEADRRMLDIQKLRRTFDTKVQLNPEELLYYAKVKEDQAHEIQKLKLAAAAIDPTRPQSQAKFMAMLPALESKPNEAFEQRQTFERCIRNLIFYGDCNTEEDVEFLMNIMSDDVVIPLAPAWDITGMLGLMADNKNAIGFRQDLDVSQWSLRAGSRFQPLGSPPGSVISRSNGEAHRDVQRGIKFMIMCKCFPSMQKHSGKPIALLQTDDNMKADYKKLIPFFEAKIDASFKAAFDLVFSDRKTDLATVVSDAQDTTVNQPVERQWIAQ